MNVMKKVWWMRILTTMIKALVMMMWWSRWGHKKWMWEFKECFAEYCFFELLECRGDEWGSKLIIKHIIEINEHNLAEEVNGFKKVDINLLKDWTMKVNAVLREIKSDNITKTNRLIKACVIFVGRKVGIKPKQRIGNAAKEP